MSKGDNKTLDYIGCNINFLRKWFEYNFTDEMSWDNYGELWNIDHIIPVKSFDLTTEKEKFTCWNWTNLTPMISSENSSKKNSVIKLQVDNMKINLNKFLEQERSASKWFSTEYCIILSG